jgi:hypothetical protein
MSLGSGDPLRELGMLPPGALRVETLPVSEAHEPTRPIEVSQEPEGPRPRHFSPRLDELVPRSHEVIVFPGLHRPDAARVGVGHPQSLVRSTRCRPSDPAQDESSVTTTRLSISPSASTIVTTFSFCSLAGALDANRRRRTSDAEVKGPVPEILGGGGLEMGRALSGSMACLAK